MIKSIFLVGGYGSRLGSVTANTPKPLLECDGYPFIKYLIDFQYNQGIHDFIFATFYKHNKFSEFIDQFSNDWPSANFDIINEETKLGTGGAIKNAALSIASSDMYLVSNGDSYIKYSITDFIKSFENSYSDGSILLTKNNQTLRYGNVEVDNNLIKQFKEKNSTNDCNDNNFINAGIYLFSKDLISDFPDGEFSLEEKIFSSGNYKFSYLISNENFIDIGINEDLNYFQKHINDYI